MGRELIPPAPFSYERRGRKIVLRGGGLPRRLAVIHVSETPRNDNFYKRSARICRAFFLWLGGRREQGLE